MKLNSVERIEQTLINGLFYGVAKAELDEKDVRRIIDILPSLCGFAAAGRGFPLLGVN